MLACRSEPLDVDEAMAAVSYETFRTHMAALSADVMAGRRPGTAGYDSAAAYVVREARGLGLEPAGVDGTYLQPIPFRRSTVAPGDASFSVGGQPLSYGTDFAVAPRIGSAETELTAPLVFAGFGISAPALGYDDFESVDVSGKLVVVIPGAPDHFGSLERTVLSSSKARNAELRDRGAVGVVVVDPDGVAAEASPRPRVGYVVPDEAAGASETGRQASDGEVASGAAVASAESRTDELDASLTVSRATAAAWVRDAGRSLDEIVASIRSGEASSFDLGVEGTLRARFSHEPFVSPNVAALLPGSDPELRHEHLVMTAHLDHLGVGAPMDGDSIYNGTLDNASGSAALLTLAEVLTDMEAPRRSILFLWVTAEESGLLGSEYFARFPTVDGEVVANQNMDGVMGMIAAASDMLAFGYEHSNLSEAVDYAIAETGMVVSPDPTPEENLFVRSDQYAFVRQGIPAIWVQSGRSAIDPGTDAQAELDEWIATRYHRPTDDLGQPVDRRGVEAELRTNLMVTHYIAWQMGPIRWDTGSFLYGMSRER